MKYTFSENIQGFLVIGIRKILSFVPLKMRYKFFENLGLLAYYLIKKRRELTIDNIKNAFPKKVRRKLLRLQKVLIKRWEK